MAFRNSNPYKVPPMPRYPRPRMGNPNSGGGGASSGSLLDPNFKWPQKPPSPGQQKQDQAQKEADAMYQATYGRVLGDIQKELASSTTGYSDPTPTTSSFLKNPMTLSMMKDRAKIKAQSEFKAPTRPLKAPTDYTNQAVE